MTSFISTVKDTALDLRISLDLSAAKYVMYRAVTLYSFCYVPDPWGTIGSVVLTGLDFATSFFSTQEKINRIIKQSHGMQELLLWQTTEDPSSALSDKTVTGQIKMLSQNFRIKCLRGHQRITGNIKYDNILIQGHSTHDTLQLDEKHYLTTESVYLFKDLAKHIKEGGIITVYGCSAGSGESNIAKSISEYCLNVSVYAPKKPIFATDVSFDSLGHPTFMKGIRDITNIYWNGERV